MSVTNRDLEFILKARDDASASIEQFKARYETIAKDIQKVPVGSQQFERLAKEMNAAQNELKVVQSYMKQVGESSSNFNKLDEGMNKVNKSSGSAKQTLMSFSQVIQDAPYGIRGVANNIDFLTQNFTNLVASSGGAKNAFSAILASFTGPMGIMFAISATTSLLTVFGDKLFSTGDSAEEAGGKISDLKSEILDLKHSLGKIDDIGMIVELAKNVRIAKEEYEKSGIVRSKITGQIVNQTSVQLEAEKKYLEAQKKLKDFMEGITDAIKKQNEDTDYSAGSINALKKQVEDLTKERDKMTRNTDDWRKKSAEVAQTERLLADAIFLAKHALEESDKKYIDNSPKVVKSLNDRADAIADMMRKSNLMVISTTALNPIVMPESTVSEIKDKMKRIQDIMSTAKIGTPDFEKWYSELNRLQKQTEDALLTPLQKAQREWQKYSGVIRQGISIISQIASQNGQAELDRIEAKKERELARIDEQLARESLSEEQKKALLAERAKVEEKYRKEEQSAKRKAWEADKTAKILSSIMDTASAVVEALPNIPLAVIVGALGAAQTAIIASQPAPRFHQGSGGPVYFDAPTSQEFPIRVRGGETFEVKTEAQQRANREGGTSVININIYGAIADKQAFKRIVEEGMREMGVTDVNKYFVNQSGKVVFS